MTRVKELVLNWTLLQWYHSVLTVNLFWYKIQSVFLFSFSFLFPLPVCLELLFEQPSSYFKPLRGAGVIPQQTSEKKKKHDTPSGHVYQVPANITSTHLQALLKGSGWGADDAPLCPLSDASMISRLNIWSHGHVNINNSFTQTHCLKTLQPFSPNSHRFIQLNMFRRIYSILIFSFVFHKVIQLSAI